MQIHISIPAFNGGAINLSGESPESLVPALNWLASLGVIGAPSSHAAPGAAAADEPQITHSEPAAGSSGIAEKPKTTRKPKEEKAAAEPKAETKKESKITIADITAAVTKVANDPRYGVQRARDLITSYGVSRASEVKPEDFDRFLADVNALLNAEPETADDVL